MYYIFTIKVKKPKGINVSIVERLSGVFQSNTYVKTFSLYKHYLGTKIKSELHFHIFHQSQELILIPMVVCYTSYLKNDHSLYKNLAH